MNESDRFIGKRYLPPASVRDTYTHIEVLKRNKNGTYHTVPIYKNGKRGSAGAALVQDLERWTEIKQGKPIVDTWFERDRSSIIVYSDEDRTHTIAEWWDEDVHQMFEQGFFSHRRDLKGSVIEYCETMGLL